MYPQIRIDFSIFYTSPLDVISNLLGEQPRHSIQTEFIPEPFYYWDINTNQSHSRRLEEKFSEMISMLKPKMEALEQLIKNYEVDLSFHVVIVMENGDAPELFSSKETIAFCASLNASFGYTIYEY